MSDELTQICRVSPRSRSRTLNGKCVINVLDLNEFRCQYQTPIALTCFSYPPPPLPPPQKHASGCSSVVDVKTLFRLSILREKQAGFSCHDTLYAVCNRTVISRDVSISPKKKVSRRDKSLIEESCDSNAFKGKKKYIV